VSCPEDELEKLISDYRDNDAALGDRQHPDTPQHCWARQPDAEFYRRLLGIAVKFTREETEAAGRKY